MAGATQDTLRDFHLPKRRHAMNTTNDGVVFSPLGNNQAEGGIEGNQNPFKDIPRGELDGSMTTSHRLFVDECPMSPCREDEG